jgi:hypothetical protein
VARAYQTYEEAAQDYLSRFSTLLDAPAGVEIPARRGQTAAPAVTLIERAGQIADISAAMVPLSRDALEADERARREAISAQLLSQATAELQLATELLRTASMDGGGQSTAGARRGADQAVLREAIRALEQSMQLPARGLATATARRRASTRSACLDEA